VPRYVEPQNGAGGTWDAPLFFEDRQNVFYVTTAGHHNTVRDFAGFGHLSGALRRVGSVQHLTPLVPRLPTTVFEKVSPVVGGNRPGGGDPSALQGFLSQSPTIRNAVGSTDAITYQGRPILPSGSVPLLPPPRRT